MNTIGRDPSDRVQVLDEDGNLVGDPPEIDEETLVDIYQDMKLARHFDQRAVSLQRQGRMGTYPPLSGQEGAQVGSAHALADGDWMVPSYREHGAALVRGLPLKQTLLYWMGSEEGNNVPEDANILPVAVPIASQVPHAAGLAWSWKLQDKDDTAGICYFGDGATSEGDFHEGLNFAGVNDVPMVFFCNNNQWAISVPRERQTASETLAQKANAYGFEGIQVDGMDPLAVREMIEEALDRARNGEPVLVESLTYRRGAHTTSDDPSRYRDDDPDLPAWRTSDPVERFTEYLTDRDVIDESFVEECEDAADEELADAVETAEELPDPESDELFEHVYAEPTPELDRQRKSIAGDD